ncbi:MAG: helix-turn-helix domain-containing protein [Alphaproteobacteria bacterium]
MQKKYINTKELSEYLGLAVSTLATFRSDDKGPPYKKIGRLVRYNVDEVETWLEENQQYLQKSLDNHDNIPKLNIIKIH